MENKEWKSVDKTDWPRGAWDNEPDKAQFVDEDTKLPCLIVRNHAGALCGYVGVPSTHPLFGKNYDKADANVHGGLTFADRCNPKATEEHGICHIVGESEDDNVWWFGFDCAHVGDLAPLYSQRYKDMGIPDFGDRYRDIEYVKAEIRGLARQLFHVEPK